MIAVLRPLLTLLGLLLLWQGIVWLFALPPYILPAPHRVALALVEHAGLLFREATVTVAEMLLGLLFGTLLGASAALGLLVSAVARRWLLPLLVASQAVPVFALAPLLVLWFGFGMASKIMMAMLVIFFPVAMALYDGLRRTEAGWLDLAHVMTADLPQHRLRILRHIRLMAALPAFASGLKIAAAVAPIGAVIGEWVGASAGLGFRMMQANARVQTDLMFAALIVLAVCAIALYAGVDAITRRLLRWQPDSHASLLADKNS
ncbi:MAG: ABC transporter permease [Ferrovibrio sp.]|uniref:ABC transporter permease n=1 Tax=Ferrovibrio sp. TaxID=1917215 RepID=UPI002618CCF3|nr:ABC transporter permease [Ferrovibrio sp.]MCW0232754.1 ABC transporter permease [Ferrovibrio sp.]